MGNTQTADLQKRERDLPDSWGAAYLRDVAACRGGYGFPPKEQGHGVGEIPFFKVSDMNRAGNSRMMKTANNYVDAEALQRLRAKTFPPGTGLFLRRAQR